MSKYIPGVATFPGPAQLSISSSSVLQATESWAEPGNEAIPGGGAEQVMGAPAPL